MCHPWMTHRGRANIRWQILLTEPQRVGLLRPWPEPAEPARPLQEPEQVEPVHPLPEPGQAAPARPLPEPEQAVPEHPALAPGVRALSRWSRRHARIVGGHRAHIAGGRCLGCGCRRFRVAAPVEMTAFSLMQCAIIHDVLIVQIERAAATFPAIGR